MELMTLFSIGIFSVVTAIIFFCVYWSYPHIFKKMIKILFLSAIVLFFLSFFLLLKNTYLVSEHDYVPNKENMDFPVERKIVFTGDNMTLSVWIAKYHSDSPIIILSHGLGGDKTDLLYIARELYKNGYNCLLYDFRAHGDSKGKVTSFGYKEQKDLKAIIDYVINDESFNNKDIGLYGFSMGAAVSILVSEEYNQVKAIISDSAYPNLQVALERHSRLMYNIPDWIIRYPIRIAYLIRFFTDPKGISCFNTVKNTNKAIFYINGKGDNKIPAEYAKKLYQNTSSYKKLWLIEDINHNSVSFRNSDLYINKLLDFLNKYLPKKSLWE